MDLTQETALVERCKAGDGEAFRTLVELHHAALFGTAYLMMGDRELARDVLQDALVKIWGHMGSLRSESSVKAWLVRIVANEAKQQLRKRRLPSAPLEEMPVALSGFRDAASELLQDDARLSLRIALKQLPPEQRQAVVLRYFSDLTVPEVASAMHEREGTVKSRLSRALARLRETLSRDEAWQGR